MGTEPCVCFGFDTKIVDKKAKCRCPLQAPNGSWHSLAADPSLLACLALVLGNDPTDSLSHWLRILEVLGPCRGSQGHPTFQLNMWRVLQVAPSA